MGGMEVDSEAAAATGASLSNDPQNTGINRSPPPIVLSLVGFLLGRQDGINDRANITSRPGGAYLNTHPIGNPPGPLTLEGGIQNLNTVIEKGPYGFRSGGDYSLEHQYYQSDPRDYCCC